jgi:hypothetical protein
MLKIAMWITLSALAACAVTETAPAEDQVSTAAASDEEDTSTQDSALTSDPEANAAGCSGTLRVCLSAFNCHHQEGINVGVNGCKTGTICCQF